MASAATDKLAKEASYAPPATRKEFLSRESFSDFKDFGPAFSPQHLKYESAGGSASSNRNQNWDLYYSSDDGVYYTTSPEVFLSRDDMESLCAITDSGFVPAANKWLVLRSTDIEFATAEILLVSDWTSLGYPSIYKFDTADPFSFDTVSYPLWQFVDEATAEASSGNFIRFSDDVYGKKLAPDSPLKLGYVLVQVPSQPVLRSAPELYV